MSSADLPLDRTCRPASSVRSFRARDLRVCVAAPIPSRDLTHKGLVMYADLRVAVVVPAHNEERLIGKVIETMPDFVDHIIVVDDASTDETGRAAKAVGDSR